jgi:hypothetical protein
MSDPANKSGSFRAPSGFLGGETIGHSSKEGRVRERDGIVWRGDEIGSLDENGQIRKKDGIVFRGDVVGQVKERTAHDKDGFIFAGEEWGYVDDHGNVRLKDSVFFKGRIIGEVKGNPQSALAFFVLQFQRLLDQAAALENEVSRADEKLRCLSKVQSMLERLPNARALGDFDRLADRLRRLEGEIGRQVHANLARKEELIRRARGLCRSTDWKATAEALKELQEKWKSSGLVPKDKADELWSRFRGAIDEFYSHRKAHFERLEREREENLRRKRHLVASAESLASSTDWKGAGAALKELQSRWKTIGHVPKEQAEALWIQFRSAQDHFYQRRAVFFEQRDRERDRKQAEWRSKMREALTHKREQIERLQGSIAHDEENVRRWHDTIYNLRPGSRADEIRDSLSHKIAEVSEKIESKRQRVRELRAAISEIEDKL